MAKQKKPPPEKTKLDSIVVGKGDAKIKAIREKFRKALDDPDMRAAMTRYVQGLLREEKKN